jgi:SAM-dependent methyltransferase
MARDERRGCCGQDFERLFDEREAARDLRAWQEDGLPDSTAELVDALRAEGVEGATVLDVGAGIGMVHIELLAAGAASALDVDLSRAYLAVARQEAERRGLADRVTYRYGDVVDLAPALPPADVVTLDRVICCYPDLPALLGAAVYSRPRVIGLVHPSDSWWMRASMSLFNAVSRLLRRGHFFYAHRRSEIDRLLSGRGYAPRHHGGSRVWRVSVYGLPEA